MSDVQWRESVTVLITWLRIHRETLRNRTDRHADKRIPMLSLEDDESESLHERDSRRKTSNIAADNGDGAYAFEFSTVRCSDIDAGRTLLPLVSRCFSIGIRGLDFSQHFIFGVFAEQGHLHQILQGDPSWKDPGIQRMSERERPKAYLHRSDTLLFPLRIEEGKRVVCLTSIDVARAVESIAHCPCVRLFLRSHL